MASYNPITTDFTGGLMGPYMRGRLDVDKFNKGLQRIENFIPSIQGPVKYREGFEWIEDSVEGNVKLISFSINNENRFLLRLSEGLLHVYTTDGLLLYVRENGVDGVDIPYLDSEIPDVRYSREVEKMVFTHTNHPPYELSANTVFDSVALYSTETDPAPDNFRLYSTESDESNLALFAGSAGSEGLTPWTFSKVDYTSHPFQKIDTSDVVMRIDPSVEVVRLTSTLEDFNFTAQEIIDMETVPYYTEYKVANQWALGRILTTAINPDVPDPSGTTCYVDPVDSVVNVEDPSVRLFALKGTGADKWQSNDRVPDDKWHVRADAAIFETSHIGAWVRIGGDKLFTNVCEPTVRPTDSEFSSQDGLTRWFYLKDYRGVEDHPVDFIYNTLKSSNYEAGSTYEVYEWSTYTEFSVDAPEGTPRERYKLKEGGSSPRFIMDYQITEGLENGAEITGTATGSIVANMSTQKQFDVFEADETQVVVKDTNLRATTGTVSVYDLTNDRDGLASHTTTLYASKNVFSNTRDTGRYFFGNLVDKWVLLRITSTQSTSATCDVLSDIPRDALTGEINNNGVFTEYRWGAWYDNNWPVAVSFYEQRRVYAGSKNDPNLVWLSSTKDDSDFRTVESDGTVLDTTGITYPLGTSSTIIRWLESGPTLIIGTESNEWQLRPNEFSAAITPKNIRITQETSIGSTQQGMRVGASVFFPHISGRSFSEFIFDFQSQSFDTKTTTKLVPTLFDNDPIISFSYQANPHAVFWIVTEAGRLITLTYRKEDDYYAWAEHTTDGTFAEVEVVPKGDTETSEDQVWAVIDRDGLRTMERMHASFIDTGEDNYKPNAAFLDSYSRYPDTGYHETPSVVIPVPDRLLDEEGCVRTVIDGLDYGCLPVLNSRVTLPEGVTVTKYSLVGLPYTGVLQGNPLGIETRGGNAYGQITRYVKQWFYLFRSLGFKQGFTEEGALDITKHLDDAPDGESPPLFTGFTKEKTLPSSQYAVDKVPMLIQDQPYPLTVISAVTEVEVK
jgi:hypothetical protein